MEMNYVKKGVDKYGELDRMIELWATSGRETCINDHAYDGENVEVYWSEEKGRWCRRCRICRRDAKKRHRDKKAHQV
jgi:hypothetical protein